MLMVTGANGHVGGAVLRRAVAEGLTVLAPVRAARPEEPGVLWRVCDLADASAVAALAADHPVEACIHAAAVPNEAYAEPDPMGAYRSNVAAAMTLLEAARAHAWRRFIHVSTGSVFQFRNDPVEPIPEDAAPAATNVYGTTKLAAERLTAMFRQTYGLSAASVRLSWVYGPPVMETPLSRGPIPSYLTRALRGEAVRESGAEFAASFTYIEDVAAGLLAAARAPALTHDVYHLGQGRNFTAADVAKAVRAAVPGADIALTGGTAPWTDHTTMRGPLACARLAEDTGFAPGVTLPEGVSRYAAWLREQETGQ